MKLGARLSAELIGTFWLVFGGCGAAVLAGSVIGWMGVSFAFGLTVLTGAYALGHISGGHFNPAVTIGLAAGKRFEWSSVGPYIAAQLVGGVLASAVLFMIASGNAEFDVSQGFASNGFDAHSPGGYSMMSAVVTEVVLTAMFLIIIMGSTDSRAPKGMAPIAIGLGLTLIHLIGIPIDNLSVNPARSTGPALFVGGWALSQLWVFWVAPIVGGVLGAVLYNTVAPQPKSDS